MALEALDHYTIHCADMTATRDFYRDVLGLTEGFRPQLPFAGHWLYCGERAVVHLLRADGALPENPATTIRSRPCVRTLNEIAIAATWQGGTHGRLRTFRADQGTYSTSEPPEGISSRPCEREAGT